MIPKRPGLEDTISTHQEDLRRLELNPGGQGFAQVEFIDGVFVSGWSGRLRGSSFRGSTATGPRVYVDVYATRASGGLTIGTLDASTRPGRTLQSLAVDLAGNPVTLTILTSGVVQVSSYSSSPILFTGSFVV